MAAPGATDLPVACTLSPDELSASRAMLLPGLAASATTVTLLPDGARLEFAAAADLLARIAAVIDRERQCCRFLRFVLDVAADGGPVRLDVTGPSGTRELMAGLLSEYGPAAS